MEESAEKDRLHDMQPKARPEKIPLHRWPPETAIVAIAVSDRS